MSEDKISRANESRNLKNETRRPAAKGYRRRYSDCFEFAPVGFFTFDRSGVILNVNPTGALLLGMDRNSLLRKSFSAFITPDSREVFDSHGRRLFETNKKQTCDVKLMSGNGHSPWVQLKNGNGDIEQFRTVINEITDRKLAEEALRRTRDELEIKVLERTAELEKINEQVRAQIYECENAEAALRESENNYSTLVEDALIGVYINKDGKIVFANDKFAAIYGYHKDELIGMESLLLVHPDDRPQVAEF